MATNVNKIDSNVVELRYVEETSPGVLPGSPVWVTIEPNAFSDFGAQIATTTREPIASDRQRKKGVVTDLDASGGFSMDLTMDNFKDLAQGFLFKAATSPGEHLDVTDAETATDTFFGLTGNTQIVVDDLIWADSFDDAGNNGLHVVDTGPTSTVIPVTSNLVLASTQTGNIYKVGHEYADADVDVVMSGSLATLVSAAGDFTDLDLVAGDWIYIGGDLTVNKFLTAANNGFARVRSVTTSTITLDKTENQMVNETGTSIELRIFVGKSIRNGSLNKTYQFERQLGHPDTGISEPQSTYLIGMKPNEFTINIPSADKVTMDLAFIGNDEETYTQAEDVKAGGTRPTLTAADAINTSSDVSRIKLSLADANDAYPTGMFAYVTDLTLSVNNNLDPNKAVGTLGAFDITAGNFEASASIEAYFTDLTSIDAVRAYSEVTLDVHLVSNNRGISIDMPAFGLGDGRPNIEKDQPVKIPLTAEGYDGTVVHTSMNHTMQMTFWEYLPTAAG